MRLQHEVGDAACRADTRHPDRRLLRRIVHDAHGRRILWTNVSRIDDAEMRELMRQVIFRLHTFHIRADDPAQRDDIDSWLPLAEKWDKPRVDIGFVASLARSKDER